MMFGCPSQRGQKIQLLLLPERHNMKNIFADAKMRDSRYVEIKILLSYAVVDKFHLRLFLFLAGCNH